MRNENTPGWTQPKNKKTQKHENTNQNQKARAALIVRARFARLSCSLRQCKELRFLGAPLRVLLGGFSASIPRSWVRAPLPPDDRQTANLMRLLSAARLRFSPSLVDVLSCFCVRSGVFLAACFSCLGCSRARFCWLCARFLCCFPFARARASRARAPFMFFF